MLAQDLITSLSDLRQQFAFHRSVRVMAPQQQQSSPAGQGSPSAPAAATSPATPPGLPSPTHHPGCGDEAAMESGNCGATTITGEAGTRPTIATRHILVLMGFLGFINIYMLQLNFLVALPVMVNHTAIDGQDYSLSSMGIQPVMKEGPVILRGSGPPDEGGAAFDTSVDPTRSVVGHGDVIGPIRDGPIRVGLYKFAAGTTKVQAGNVHDNDGFIVTLPRGATYGHVSHLMGTNQVPDQSSGNEDLETTTPYVTEAGTSDEEELYTTVTSDHPVTLSSSSQQRSDKFAQFAELLNVNEDTTNFPVPGANGFDGLLGSTLIILNSNRYPQAGTTVPDTPENIIPTVTSLEDITAVTPTQRDSTTSTTKSDIMSTLAPSGMTEQHPSTTTPSENKNATLPSNKSTTIMAAVIPSQVNNHETQTAHQNSFTTAIPPQETPADGKTRPETINTAVPKTTVTVIEITPTIATTGEVNARVLPNIKVATNGSAITDTIRLRKERSVEDKHVNSSNNSEEHNIASCSPTESCESGKVKNDTKKAGVSEEIYETEVLDETEDITVQAMTASEVEEIDGEGEHNVEFDFEIAGNGTRSLNWILGEDWDIYNRTNSTESDSSSSSSSSSESESGDSSSFSSDSSESEESNEESDEDDSNEAREFNSAELDDLHFFSNDSREYINGHRFRRHNGSFVANGNSSDDSGSDESLFEDDDDDDDDEDEDDDDDEDDGDDNEDEDGEGEDKEEGDEDKSSEYTKSANGEITLAGQKFPSTVCFEPRMIQRPEPQQDGEFVWAADLQERLRAAFSWGYILTQLVGGRLTGAMGGKMLLLMGVLLAAILTVLTPTAAAFGPYWLLAARIMVGAAEGVCVPAMQAVLAQWAPPLDRTVMVAFTYSGLAVGAALGGPLSEWLVLMIGWRGLFYSQGAVALVWCILWYFLVTENPSQHPRISLQEKNHITSSIGVQHAWRGLPVPWFHIFRSRHVVAVVMAELGFSWAWFTLLHHAREYSVTVLHVPPHQVRVAWGTALMAMWVIAMVYATLSDWIRRTNRRSTVVVRRVANTVCALVTAGCLIGVAQSSCSQVAVMVWSSMALVMGLSASFSTFRVNSIELAPNHAAAIAGLSGTISASVKILSPLYVAYLTNGQATLERWRMVWYTGAIILTLTNCLNFLMASSKEQTWNRPVAAPVYPKREVNNLVQRRTRLPRPPHHGQLRGNKNPAYVFTEQL